VPPQPSARTDPLVDFVGLTDVALRRRREPVDGLFIAEGTQVAARALAAGFRPRTMVVIPERLDRADVSRLVSDVQGAGGLVEIVEAERLRQHTGFDVHRGVMVSFARAQLPAFADLAARSTTLAVLEAIVDHTNVGAIIRSVAALGVDGVLLDPRCADPLYRRAIRTSMGAVFAVPYARCAVWPGDLQALITQGFRILALTPHDAELDLSELRLAADERVAVVLGAEGTGLSSAALAAATTRVAIAMAPGVDSLNVATAAAVAFWGVERARSQP
jgi:tRNA G18 (ribose-2'-O)-methylase SpoU